MSMPRKIRCQVEAITDHGGRVYTVDLAPTSPVPQFKPGQFLHLTIDPYAPSSFWPESRVFSIASSPRERTRLRICYSVKGRYTKKMEETLRLGGEVWVKLPYGDFVVASESDAVLIAGGTGISAFTAFLEALAPESPQKVTLVYGARTPALFLFQEMILRQLERVPQFDAVFFSETEAPAFTQRLARLPRAPRCLTGPICLDQVFSPLAPEALALGSVFHLSGPPAMLKALGADLHARGVGDAHIRTDAWE